MTVDRGLELLDTPGILWPKFEDVETGMRLAFTGAVKDDIMDVEILGCHLMAFLGTQYPNVLAESYRLKEVPAREAEENEVAYGYRLLEACAQKRGMRMLRGGLTLSGWPGCCWMSTGVASWDALPWNSRKRFKEIV